MLVAAEFLLLVVSLYGNAGFHFEKHKKESRIATWKEIKLY